MINVIRHLDGTAVYTHSDSVVVVDENYGGPHKNSLIMAEFFICDDCGEAYLGPPYYTWDEDSCRVTETQPDGTEVEIPHDCTYNLCPGCAEFLEPDDENDPRRPSV